MNIILISPPGALNERRESHAEIGQLAAAIESSEHHLLLIDGQVRTIPEIHAAIVEMTPVVVCLILHQGYSLSMWLYALLVKMGTNRNFHLTAVGKAVVAMPRIFLKTFSELDSIVTGVPEFGIMQLLDMLSHKKNFEDIPGLIFRDDDGEIVINHAPPFPELPESTAETFDYLNSRNAYSASVRTCRTTHEVPNFSLHRVFRRLQWTQNCRFLPAPFVVSTLQKMSQQLGIHDFFFVDENFLGDGKHGKARAEQIASSILEHNLKIRFSIRCFCQDVEAELFALLKRAGLTHVKLGFVFQPASLLTQRHERAVIAPLQQAVEILERLNLQWQPDYILFDPLLSFQEFKACLKFIEESILARIEPTPGISVFNQLELHPDFDSGRNLANDGSRDPRMQIAFRFIDYYKKKKISANQHFAWEIAKSGNSQITDAFCAWRCKLYESDFQILQIISRNLESGLSGFEEQRVAEEVQQSLLSYHKKYFEADFVNIPEKSSPVQFKFPEQFMLFALTKNWSHITYRGHALWQNLFDLHLTREFLFQNQPDLIIETGTFRGGSALFFADMMTLTGKPPKVISIDPTPEATPPYDGVTYLRKSSCDPEVIQWLLHYIEERNIQNIFIQLDALHDEHFVYNELSLYAPLLRPHNYILVQDGAAHGTNSRGPLAAIKRFLSENTHFAYDDSICCDEFARVTWSPLGWLKKNFEPVRKQNGKFYCPEQAIL